MKRMPQDTLPLYFGSAYYPEDWPAEEMDADIGKMTQAGMNVARIAEFAWRKMEPAEGRFDFAWLHEVVDKLAAAGIRTILGTPTATPPIWRSQKHPDVMAVRADDRWLSHGGRRHCCSNNNHYREYSAKIVERMGMEFGRAPNVSGWQSDNEITPIEGGCFCPVCLAGFTEWLRERFENIDALNRAWNLNLFSQAYDSFDEIPAPRDTWHNPHLHLAWKQYQQDSTIGFVHMQADILRKYTSAPIGTDMMPLSSVCHEKINLPLDVVQINHYHSDESLWESLFWYDHLRTLKSRPFWVTETATSWNGDVAVGQDLKPEGFCRANTWLPIASGAEANLFWLWRTHWAGHELMHGAVLSTDGRPMHIWEEIRQTAADFQKAAGFIRATQVKSEIALHFSAFHAQMLEVEPVVCGLRYEEELRNRFYRPLLRKGLRPDVITPGHSLDRYKVLFSPLTLTLEVGDLPKRIAAWVRDGGTWVAGPLCDVRNAEGTKYRHTPYGMLEELTGIRGLFQIPDKRHAIRSLWADGTGFTGDRWYEVFEESVHAVVKIMQGHSALLHKSLVLKVPVGKGAVVLLGSLPTAEDFENLLHLLPLQPGRDGFTVSGSVAAAPRTGETVSGLILTELAGAPAVYQLIEDYDDILTARPCRGEIKLKPYDVLVLRRTAERNGTPVAP